MAKVCKVCGEQGHTPFYCPKKKRKPINRIGKVGKAWRDDRARWIKNHPADYKGFWYCYLRISPNCQYRMDESTLTLDHVVSRSRDPSKRGVQKNFKPACGPCNALKGSKNLNETNY